MIARERERFTFVTAVELLEIFFKDRILCKRLNFREFHESLTIREK